MEVFRKITFVLLSVILLGSYGCGGGSSGSGAVFGNSSTSGGTTPGTTTPTGTAAPFSLSVATDISTVDANNGTVLATATLKNASSDTVSFTDPDGKVTVINAGTSVPDQLVTFTILAGPAIISSTTPSPRLTDVNGSANIIITTQDTQSTTNVLIEAKQLC
jgi:hypothetical protein